MCKESASYLFSLALALDFHFALDLSLARAFALDLTLALDRTFDLTLDLDLGFALSLDLDLARARARALNRALSLDLDLDLDRTNLFDSAVNLSILSQKLEVLQGKNPDIDSSSEVRLAYKECLLQTWCNGLRLDRELLNLSPSESQALADYFYICTLMVHCKESAVRVSREVWESIENAMVLPTPDSES